MPSGFLKAWIGGLLLSAALLAQADAPSSCDLNRDALVNSSDIDLASNMALGKIPCTANIAGPGVCNAVVVQRVINASLGRTCVLSDGSHSVTLNWVASTSADVAGYRVHRSSASGGPYTALNTSLVAVTSYVDTAVEAGKTYFYVVTAVDKNGVSSAYSNEAPATLPTP